MIKHKLIMIQIVVRLTFIVYYTYKTKHFLSLNTSDDGMFNIKFSSINRFRK